MTSSGSRVLLGLARSVDYGREFGEGNGRRPVRLGIVQVEKLGSEREVCRSGCSRTGRAAGANAAVVTAKYGTRTRPMSRIDADGEPADRHSAARPAPSASSAFHGTITNTVHSTCTAQADVPLCEAMMVSAHECRVPFFTRP